MILLSFLFLFLVLFNNFFIIPVDIENAIPKLALDISTCVPIIVAKYAMKMLPLLADKTIKRVIKIIKRLK